MKAHSLPENALRLAALAHAGLENPAYFACRLLPHQSGYFCDFFRAFCQDMSPDPNGTKLSGFWDGRAGLLLWKSALS